MAIYSLHHAAIGKTTQRRPYTAAAHVRYIARSRACTRLFAARMPGERLAAQRWFKQQEKADRKNARVCDKVLLALPRELDSGQRARLVRGFAERITGGRASWIAAFHDHGADADNPHCHLVVRDRDPETGKRVVGMSEKGSTDRLRQLWEDYANRALKEAGRTERIDRRTLRAQGIRRRPAIHEGLSAQEMVARGKRVRSRPINYRNGVGARNRQRVVDYGRLDRGRSRPGYNRFLRETEADYWAAVDNDRVARQPVSAEAAGRVGSVPMDWLKKIERQSAKLDKARDNFFHDPSKPVVRGKDAPRMTIHEIDYSGRVMDEKIWDRPLTAREQQQMRLPEAIYKKVVKPLAQKGYEKLSGASKGEPGKSASFSEKLARDRQAKAAEPQKRAKEKAATLDRWKRDREKQRER